MTGLTSIYMFNLIINLKSKYALISALRVNICSIFLEFVFALSYIYLYMVILGFSLNNIKHNTGFINYTFINTFSSIFILTYVLFESKRAPFDHTESESELVAGHIIEFGGRNLLIFYFSEYVHFFFISY